MDACWRYGWSVDVRRLSAYVIVSWLHWLVVLIDGEIVLESGRLWGPAFVGVLCSAPSALDA